MAAKIKRIIEYQDDRQRTPEEALEFLRDEIARGECTHLFALYRTENKAGWVYASEKRDYKHSAVLWDVEQWKRFLINNEDD